MSATRTCHHRSSRPSRPVRCGRPSFAPFAPFGWAAALGALLAIGPGVASADTLLVANKSEATVSLVDLPSGEVRATLPTGTGPHEVAVSPDGRWAVVTDYGTGPAPGSTLTVIDVPAGRVERTISLGEHRRPHGIVWTGSDRLLVTAEADRALLVIAMPAGTVERVIDTGQDVSHMVVATPDGSRAFVANIGSGSMTALDLTTGKRIADVATGAGAEGIAISPDGRRVYVSNREADTVSVVDAGSLEVLGTVESPGFPIRAEVTPDGRRLLVSNASAGTVTVIDTAPRAGDEQAKAIARLASTVDLRVRLESSGDAGRLLAFGDSPVPIGIEIDPAGERAYVAAANADAVVVIDLATLAIVDQLPTGAEPDGMGWSKLDVQVRDEAPPAAPKEESGAP